MARNLPLHRLDTFCVVARHLSIKDAADEMCVTASAVSHQIKALEGRVGMPLFERGVRSLRLTPAGCELFREIEPLIRGIEDVTKRWSGVARTSTVRICLPATFATECFMPRFKAFADHQSGLDVRIETTESDRGSRRPGVDLSVVLANHRPPGKSVTPLFRARLVPAACPETAAKVPYGLPIFPQDVNLIVHRDDPRAWHRWAKAAGTGYAKPAGVMQFDSSASVVSAAEKGLGIALVPLPLLKARFDAGTLVRLADRELETRDRYYLVYLSGNGDENSLRALGAWMAREFETDAGTVANNTRRLRTPPPIPETHAGPD